MLPYDERESLGVYKEKRKRREGNLGRYEEYTI